MGRDVVPRSNMREAFLESRIKLAGGLARVWAGVRCCVSTEEDLNSFKSR